MGFVDAAHRLIDRVVRRFRMNDAANAASMIMFVTTASTGAAFWHFYPLVVACLEPISGASPAELALLSPAYFDTLHTHFRETFTLLTLFDVFLWWTLLKFASRRGQKVRPSMLAGGVAVTMLTVAILSLPYRLLRHNEFEVATWNGYRCYVTGEREAEVLLFCPRSTVPRNHIVARSDSDLKRLGDTENIFTQLSPSNGDAQGGKP